MVTSTLLVVGQREGGAYAAQLYRNNGVTTNLPPTAPGGLTGRARRRFRHAALGRGDGPEPDRCADVQRPRRHDQAAPTSSARLARPDGLRRVVAAGTPGSTGSSCCGARAGPDVLLERAGGGCVVPGVALRPRSDVRGDAPPTLTPIADQTIREDESTPALALTVGDPAAPADALTLTAVADDASLVPAAGFHFDGTGAERTLVVTPAPDAHGETWITVTVRNPAGNRAAQRHLAVLPVNDPPVATPQLVNLNEDESASIRLLATDRMATRSSSTSCARRAGPAGRTAPELVYRPEADFFGEDEFLYQVDDGGSGRR